MIRVDYRIGSVDLIAPLSKFVKVKKTTLASGDISFGGNGPDGRICRVGIERKNVHDLMSSLESGRLVSKQIPGLITDYDYRYLLIEGIYRAEPRTGMLQISRYGQWQDYGFGRARFYYHDLQGWLNTFAVQANLRLLRTASATETVYAVIGLYRWWSKEWAEHKSLLPVLKRTQQSGRDVSDGDDGQALSLSIHKVPVARKQLAQLPSIGWVRSAAVYRKFKRIDPDGVDRTLLEALNGSDDDWRSISGFGKVLTEKARRELGCLGLRTERSAADLRGRVQSTHHGDRRGSQRRATR